jgi:hypothetical protein
VLETLTANAKADSRHQSQVLTKLSDILAEDD